MSMMFQYRSRRHDFIPSRQLDIADAVDASCEPLNAEGSVERARAKADAAAKKLGLLVDILHANGLIDDADVHQLVDHWDLEQAE